MFAQRLLGRPPMSGGVVRPARHDLNDQLPYASLLPADTSLACDYVPLSAPLTLGLTGLGTALGVLKLVLLALVLIKAAPKQAPLAVVVTLGAHSPASKKKLA